MNYLRI